MSLSFLCSEALAPEAGLGLANLARRVISSLEVQSCDDDDDDDDKEEVRKEEDDGA